MTTTIRNNMIANKEIGGIIFYAQKDNKIDDEKFESIKNNTSLLAYTKKRKLEIIGESKTAIIEESVALQNLRDSNECEQKSLKESYETLINKNEALFKEEIKRLSEEKETALQSLQTTLANDHNKQIIKLNKENQTKHEKEIKKLKSS